MRERPRLAFSSTTTIIGIRTRIAALTYVYLCITDLAIIAKNHD